MSTTSPSGYVYEQGATNVNPFWENSDNPVDYIKNIELVDDRQNSGAYIVRYTDQDGAGHTIGTIAGFYTSIRADQTGNSIKIYGTKNGVEELIVSFSTSGSGGGGISEEEARTIIEGYGYQTASQVEATITGKGYQTASQVEASINAAIYGAIQAEY